MSLSFTEFVMSLSFTELFYGVVPLLSCLRSCALRSSFTELSDGRIVMSEPDFEGQEFGDFTRGIQWRDALCEEILVQVKPPSITDSPSAGNHGSFPSCPGVKHAMFPSHRPGYREDSIGLTFCGRSGLEFLAKQFLKSSFEWFKALWSHSVTKKRDDRREYPLGNLQDVYRQQCHIERPSKRFQSGGN